MTYNDLTAELMKRLRKLGHNLYQEKHPYPETMHTCNWCGLSFMVSNLKENMYFQDGKWAVIAEDIKCIDKVIESVIK